MSSSPPPTSLLPTAPRILACIPSSRILAFEPQWLSVRTYCQLSTPMGLWTIMRKAHGLERTFEKMYRAKTFDQLTVKEWEVVAQTNKEWEVCLQADNVSYELCVAQGAIRPLCIYSTRQQVIFPRLWTQRLSVLSSRCTRRTAHSWRIVWLPLAQPPPKLHCTLQTNKFILNIPQPRLKNDLPVAMFWF